MGRIFLTIVLALGLSICHSQEIESKRVLFGYRFTQDGKKLSWKEILEKTELYPESHELIKKSKTQFTISSITGFIGGGLIGVPIGQSFTDKKPNWALAYVGGGIAAISMSLDIIDLRNEKKGTEIYNSSLKSTSLNTIKPKFKIIGNVNGLGLSMIF